MAKKMINNSGRDGVYGIYGYLYEVIREDPTKERQDRKALLEKVTGENSKNPGTPFISGVIKIATDEACTNIVEVHYTYVTPTYAKSGKPNTTYKILKGVIDGTYKSVMESSKDEAVKLKATPALDVNDFYVKDMETGEERLVSYLVNEGGFLEVINKLPANEDERARFDVDMLIKSAKRIDADEERGLAEKVIISGSIFNFRNEIMPVEFTVYGEKPMDYFENLEPSASEPVFTRVRGRHVSTVIDKVKEETSAFGEPMITHYSSTKRENVIYWAPSETYIFDDEETLTKAEVKKMVADREVKLAAEKARRDQWFAEHATPAATKTADVKDEEFNF